MTTAAVARLLAGTWTTVLGTGTPVTPPPSGPPPYTQDSGLGTNGGLEPTGYTSYSSLSGATIVQRLTAAGTHVMSVGPGTYTLAGFSSNAYDSNHVATSAGFIGAGSSKTFLTMAAGSSSGAAFTSNTNPYTALRFNTDPGGFLEDFTFTATAQSVSDNSGSSHNANNTYNGISIVASDWTIRRIKVLGVPGTYSAPPGETFPLNLFKAYGTILIEDVEIDGQGASASNLGVNGTGTSATVGTTNMTVNRMYSHNNPYSGGIALWESKGSFTFNDCTFDMCRCFWNIERMTGTVDLYRPRIGTLHTLGAAVTGIFCEADATWGATDAKNFRFNIHDPRNLDDTPYTGSPISVLYGSANDGGTNYYGRSNFRCYNASGTDISSSFYSTGGNPYN
jgi:hypothetical protein